MNLTSQEYLAKLLAKENLIIQHGNYSTASFEPKNRILRLPLWEDKGKAVYDLLVGHEVGHALYTPVDGWHDADKKIGSIPRAYLNIVEDIRIERMIQETYPGIVKQFKAGYERLFDDNLFGTNDRKPTNLMDKLNVHSKGRGIIPIEFDAEEQPLVDEAMTVETWDDVLVICQKLHDFLSAKKEEKEEEEAAMMPGDDGDAAESESMSSDMEGTEPGDASEDEDGESDGEGKTLADVYDEEKAAEEAANAKEEVDYDDPTSSFTEAEQRANEEDLLDKDSDDKQMQYCSGMSDAKAPAIIVDYKELMAARDAVEYAEDGYLFSSHIDEYWDDKKKGFESTANMLVKDFERKKAAYEYQKATTAKKGSLDMNKLHSYKYNDDIFLTVTRMAQAKSHGIIMFIDQSGSMSEIYQDVINQAITIAMFCRRAHIPFDAYTFTSYSHYRSSSSKRDRAEDLGLDKNGAAELDVSNLQVVNVLSSSMKNKEFKKASRDLFGAGILHAWDRPFYVDRYSRTDFDEMGTTPLTQTAVLAFDVIKDFERLHKVQKVNVMILTDGYADGITIADDDHADVKNSYGEYGIKVGNKMITGDRQGLYKNVLVHLRKMTGAKITGFFLCSKKSEFTREIGWREAEDMGNKGINKAWNTDHHMHYSKYDGYDDYFIVRVGSKAPAEFAIEDNANKSIKDIKREFAKFNKNKKSVRQLVNKITDAVAA